MSVLVARDASMPMPPPVDERLVMAWYAATPHTTSDPAPLDVGDRLDALTAALHKMARDHGAFTWRGINSRRAGAETPLQLRDATVVQRGGSDRVANGMVRFDGDLAAMERAVCDELRRRGLSVLQIDAKSPLFVHFRWDERAPLLISLRR
jgi:hypothetical protein